MTDSRYQYFSVEELSCHCGQCDKGPGDMDPALMIELVAIRRELGFPIPLSSSIRCRAHNNAVSKTGLDGPHTTGKAIDARLHGWKAAAFMAKCYEHGLIAPGLYGRGGLGISQKGLQKDRFVHIDTLSNDETKGPRPWVWSY